MPGELYRVMMVVGVGLSLSRSQGGQGNGLCSGDTRQWIPGDSTAEIPTVLAERSEYLFGDFKAQALSPRYCWTGYQGRTM